MRIAMVPKYRDPGRLEKIRQSRLGKPRPKHVVEAMVAAHVGKKWSDETRKRSLEARKRKYPQNYAPWTPEEDELVRTLSIRKAVKMTGRSAERVKRRRAELGLTNRNEAAP